ncbi:hypothetical protein SCRDD08_01068 [Streptococcus cristatus]|uniref:Uncharacterized protein n=1 Tax=Streptococcus cristatus TaxID=45634 RepID=A0A139N1X8_STRCR|nr:hypothetical protein SCRDD08_01068 [Streptococcus cristatus]
MKLYLKGDYTKKIPYGYLELAGKMWFPEEKQVSYSMLGIMMHYKRIFL